MLQVQRQQLAVQAGVDVNMRIKARVLICGMEMRDEVAIWKMEISGPYILHFACAALMLARRVHCIHCVVRCYSALQRCGPLSPTDGPLMF